jgi:acyl-CoA thioester hydrolase
LIRVRFADTDQMGVAHHASYLTYFEAGRVEYLRRRDLSYVEWLGIPVRLPIVELSMRFHRPARFDQQLVVTTWVDKLTQYSIRFAYRVSEVGANEKTYIVKGHTRQALTDAAGELREIPEAIAERLAGPELSSRPENLV